MTNNTQKQKNKDKKVASFARHHPTLRFAGFDDEWGEKRLGELSCRIGDGIHSTPVYDEYGEYFFINGNNLINGSVKVNINTKKVNYSEFLKHQRELDLNTIFISINGTIGNVSFYNNEKIILGKSVCYIKLNKEVNKLFMFYILKYNKTQRHFISELTGSTIKNLSLKSITNTKIKIPTKPEQEKIASFLGWVDEWLGNLKNQKEELEKYKKGIMQQIFPSKDEKNPTLRFSNFSDEWEEKRLGEVSNFWNGKAHEQDISESGYIVVNSKFISRDGKIKKYSDKQIFPLFKNDITIVMSDIPNGKALAKCFLIDSDDKYTLNQRIGRIKSDEIFSNFLVRILNRNKYYLKFNNGVSQTNLRKDEVLGCPLIFPQKEEQEKIASFLTSIDDIIQSTEQKITETEKWKKGLMQRLFV